jgi:hypothetical protein
MVMALTPLKVGRFNDGLRGGIDGGGSNGTGRYLEVLSGGWRWRDAVAERPSSGEVGGR